jgi:basic membrane lipoprotein Med (substrate-binding protein (PBP1-ABC) superfamily)
LLVFLLGFLISGLDFFSVSLSGKRIFKIVLITDAGSITDRSFNQSA